MSRTTNPGKRGSRLLTGRPESPEIREAQISRHTFGRTEKILRRNRRIWTRLVSKRRRRLDKQAVAGA